MGSVEVAILDTNLRHLDRGFTYVSDDPLPAGALVRVPFHGKLRTGIVLGDSEPFDRASTVRAVLGPGLPEWMIGFARMLADQTLSDLPSVLAVMVPARVKQEEAREPGVPVAVSGHTDPDLLAAPAMLFVPGLGDDHRDRLAEHIAGVVSEGGRATVVLADADPGSRTAAAIISAVGEAAAWLGSDASDRLRYRAWLRVRRGEASVAIGGRSAIFAPHIPSLIVVADEADPAHKEGRAPRFHSRDVAALLASMHGCSCLLIGTPPSIEARIDADPRRGRLSILRSRHAVSPSVRVVEPSGLVPSPNTMRILDPTKGRICVLVHRGEDLAAATERLSRHLSIEAVAVDARSDAATLGAVCAADGPPVLVGSPVLAADREIAGIDTLVIAGADAALASPGSRATEELVGSWWRILDAARPKRVLIESKDRNHHAIAALIALDHDVFARAEAETRHALGYPPYQRIVRFQTDEEGLQRLKRDLEGRSMLGPMRDAHDPNAFVVAVKGDPSVVPELAAAVASWRADGVRFKADVDPWDLVEARWRS